MIVVSDTSPLNYLVLIGHAGILPALFHRVIAPPAVIAEMLRLAAPVLVSAWAGAPPHWLEIITPSSIDRTLPLGIGETEAIALAQEFRADALLLDERKAVNVARRLGLSVTGTLGVVELAAERGLLFLPGAIAALRRTNFRGPEKLIAELLRRDELRRSQGSA